LQDRISSWQELLILVKNVLKTTIKKNHYRPIQQIYQDEQSKIVKKFGDMTVAAALPQFTTKS
jgi:hypothetical protein